MSCRPSAPHGNVKTSRLSANGSLKSARVSRLSVNISQTSASGLRPGARKLTEEMERWARYLQARTEVADRREALADEREKIADQREALADEREKIADERESDAGQRELGANNVLGRPVRHNAERAKRDDQRVQWQHEAALREQANIDQEQAASEREHAREQAQSEASDPPANGEPADPPANGTVVGLSTVPTSLVSLSAKQRSSIAGRPSLIGASSPSRDVRLSLQDASGLQTSEIGSRTNGTESQTTASRWQTNERHKRINARARLRSVNVSDCSAPKTGVSASEPMFSATRRTSTVRWPKANVMASMTSARSDPNT